MYKCEFCDKEFKTKSNFSFHQKTTKYCLEKQGKELEIDNKCKFCKKNFTKKQRLESHLEICKFKPIDNTEIDNLNKELLEKNNRIKELEDKLYKILEKSLDK
jgi:hypothetical protein